MKVLSIEQMNKLEELGVDVSNASMCYISIYPYGDLSDGIVPVGKDFNKNFYNEFGDVFTLQDIIELLPCEIFTSRSNFYLNITKFDGNSYTISYEIQLQDGSIEEIILQADDILECSYQMLIWVIENGHLKTK